ncbi:MAG: hypothetical protein KF705_09590 [Phycisphaeraceae bacterium]|nr:hypothetical protein [Phycisphaeraceae bacterium]
MAVSIPLGVVHGSGFQVTFQALNPVIRVLSRSLTHRLDPISVLWFGISDAAPIFLIFLPACSRLQYRQRQQSRTSAGVCAGGRNFGCPEFGCSGEVIVPATLPRSSLGFEIALRHPRGWLWRQNDRREFRSLDSLIIGLRNAGKRYDLVI